MLENFDYIWRKIEDLKDVHLQQVPIHNNKIEKLK